MQKDRPVRAQAQRDDAETTPLRDRKKLRTRDTLIEVAMRLFGKHGYEETTVEDIAAAAEVAPRTFYRYFPTKEAVVFLGQQEEDASFMEVMLHREPGEGDFELLKRALHHTFATVTARNLKYMGPMMRLMRASPALLSYAHQQIVDAEALFIRGLLAGQRRSREAELRATVVAAATIAAMRAVFMAWLEAGMHGAIWPQLDEAIAMLGAGFEEPALKKGTKKGRGRRAAG